MELIKIAENFVLHFSWYLIVALVFLLFSAFVAGYRMTNITWQEVFDSLAWPISIVTLIGNLVRLFVERTFK